MNKFLSVGRGFLAIILAAVIVGGVCSYCHSSPKKKEPIRIGAVFQLTGGEAKVGQEELNGLRLAAKERKEILGRPIKVYVGDAATETAAITETKRLITAKKVLCVFGSTNMSNALAIPRVAEKYGVPTIEIDSWDDPLTEQGWKHYFMACQKSSVFAKTYVERVVDYFAPLLGKKPEELRVAVVYDDWAEYVVGVLLDSLKKRGIEPVYVGHNPWNTQDFTAVIEGIKAQEPIDIFITEQVIWSAINFRKQMLVLGFKPKIIFAMGVGWEMYDFPETLGAKNVEGIFTWSWPAPEMNFKPAQEFGKKYKKRYGESSGVVGVIAYSAAMVVFDKIEEILKEHGKVDSALLTEALRKVDIDHGVLPMYWGIKFDEKGTNLKVGECNILQWQNGKRVVVWPEKIASGKAKQTW